MLANFFKIQKILFLLSTLTLFLSPNFLFALNEIKIINKVDNEIITNIDVELEYQYLVALNNDLKNIPKNDALKISKESLIREKIKVNELKKFYVIEEFNNKELLEEIFKNFYKKLNLQNENEFKNYLFEFNLSPEQVKEKIKIEILWNQLIGSKFSKQIKIDENSLREKIKKNKLNFSNTFEYDLSEIVFQANTRDDLKSKINEIKLNIDTMGFSSTANKFSVSESSKFGGKIGKVLESQLSKEIVSELKKLEIGQMTNPINIGSNFLIILVNDKKVVEFKKDEEDVLRNMIEFEKRRQFEQFSQIYFNKIKLNTKIDGE